MGAAGGQRAEASPRSQGLSPADHQGAALLPDCLVGAKEREHRARNMGFLKADTSPFAYDPTSGPMSGYFNALPHVIDAGIPKAALSRDAPAWRRWTKFCAGVPTQTWRLDRNAHSVADPVGFDRDRA